MLFSCNTQQTLTLITDDDKIQISVEAAQTPEEHTKGLMYRTNLKENQGMLFIFPDEQPRTFWMKNTYIHLDIIFFDAKNKVVDLKQDFQPCKKDPCESYTSVSAKYVLEVNAGFVEKHNIKIGHEFILEN